MLARGGTWIHTAHPRGVRIGKRTRRSLGTCGLAHQVDIDAIEDGHSRQGCRALHRQLQTVRVDTEIEIGESLKLPFYEIAELDRTGKTSAGKPAIEHAEAAKVAIEPSHSRM